MSNFTLEIKQGSTLKLWWALEYADGTVVDLAAEGYTIGRLHVRDDYASAGGAVLLELTTGNGGVVIDRQQDADGEWWSGYLYASASATAALEPWGEGVFDFEISNGVDVISPYGGVAVLKPEATA